MKLVVGETTTVVPPDIYKAIIKDIQHSTTFKRACLIFHIEIAEGPHKGVVVKGFCNLDYKVFSNKTKIYGWYCIATGEAEYQPGDEMDTDHFFNKLFEVRIETRVSKKTKIEFSNVVEIIKLLREL